jgi:TetR/AcrR family transcriptional regulator
LNRQETNQLFGKTSAICLYYVIMTSASPGQTVSPKQRRAVRTKARIFRAGAELFAAKGPAGARVDEIAQLAGVNKERIYAYFGSKGGLYREVLIDVYARAAHNKRLLALTEDDIETMTGTVVDTFFEIHEENPSFWRLLSWENLNGGSGLRAIDWQQIRSAYIAHLQALYTIGQKRGVFRADVDFTTYLMLLFSMTYFYFSNRITTSRLLDVPLSGEAVRRQIETQLLTITRHGVFATEA